MKRIFSAAALLSLLVLFTHTNAFAQVTAITYQGRVTANGTNFTGTGQFKFAIVTTTNNTTATASAKSPVGGGIVGYTVTAGGSGYLTPPAVSVTGGGGSGATATATISGGVVTIIAAGAAGSGYTSQPTVTVGPPPVNYISYWSNDGTSSAGAEPVAAVSVGVTNGLFTVFLGDAALTNMLPIYASTFTQPNLQLRIWFNDGVHGFAALSPVQNLTPAPLAVYATLAGTASAVSGPVAAGQISGTVSYATSAGTASTVSGLVPAAQLSGTVASTNLPTSPGFSGTVTAGAFAGNGSEVTNVSAATLGGQPAGNFWQLAGNNVAVGQFIGSTNNQAMEIHVNGQRVVLFQPDFSGFSPNLINGWSGNAVLGFSTFGAVIAGGGSANIFLGGSNVVTQSLGTIGGGAGNVVQGPNGTIAGGYQNQVSGYAGTIAGGQQNTNKPSNATIAGGQGNTIFANGSESVISGGSGNQIDSSGATISGGSADSISSNAYNSSIVGGSQNIIQTGAAYSVIGGGFSNVISNQAQYAVIPGGSFNAVGGNNSFAAGQNAKAIHNGSFVWADNYGGPFSSSADNQASFRVQGGVRFTSGSGLGISTVAWTPGSASWSFTSDRNTKDHIQPVKPQDVLAKLSRVPIAEWNYIGFAQRHLGPMAQDFHAEFPLNENDKVLNDADLHGVALAAIQGLNEKMESGNRKAETQMEALKTENAELKARLKKLEQLVLEKK